LHVCKIHCPLAMVMTISARRFAMCLHAPVGFARFKSSLAAVATQVPRSVGDQVVPFTDHQKGIAQESPPIMPPIIPTVVAPRHSTELNETALNPAHFVQLLRSYGTDFFSGVPDSLLKDVCAYISEKVSGDNHRMAANEGTALALAAGHHLATNAIPCVYLQNSGLGNIVNPLLSLCSDKVYSIPVLLVIGWRGEPGTKDEPQHMLQGSVTPTLLEEMGVPSATLPSDAEGAFQVIEKAYAYMQRTQAPFALLVPKNTFQKYVMTADQGAFSGPDMLRREEILEMIAEHFPDAPLVTTTGFTSREVFEMREARGDGHSNDFLTVGSMGHCSSIALGVALAQPRREVLCIDGDGAALMHMGALATAGLAEATNFKHVLINNAVHDSVGGQPTGCGKINFPAIAQACGYRSAAVACSVDEISCALKELKDNDGPCFLEIRALPGARKDLGRPTTSTLENKQAFMDMLRQD